MDCDEVGIFLPPVSGAVDNRRTLCDHCSLRTDLPGFIDREHAQANKEAIASGALFPCHMIQNPLQGDAKVCLGAAIAAKATLQNGLAANQASVYDDLDTYVETQAGGRKTNQWLMHLGEWWYDRFNQLWFGWWEQAPAGNWHYLLTTLADNNSGSVYLFFDQFQQLFGPVELARRERDDD